MGAALVAGLLSAGWAEAADIVVVEPVGARRDELAAAHPGLGVAGEVSGPLEGAVVAVKPGDVEAGVTVGQLLPPRLGDLDDRQLTGLGPSRVEEAAQQGLPHPAATHHRKSCRHGHEG